MGSNLTMIPSNLSKDYHIPMWDVPIKIKGTLCQMPDYKEEIDQWEL